jgi:hypothetical protein
VVAEYSRLTAGRRDDEDWDKGEVEIIDLEAEMPEASSGSTEPPDA